MTLRDARRRKGLTQKDLAGIVGISAPSLSWIENYKAFPRAETRNRLQKIFGSDLEFYPASVLVEMIARFIGSDPKIGVQRARFLKSEINRVVECIHLDVLNTKPIKS